MPPTPPHHLPHSGGWTLALESSSPRCSWALASDGAVVAHGATLERASGALFATLHGQWPPGTRPDRILIGVGPGSFSGIRVAIAAARGMARVWGCSVIPMRSTHAVARNHPEESRLGLFSDAKRGQLFLTVYRHGRMVEASRLIPRAELTRHRDACSKALALTPLPGLEETAQPDAADLFHVWLATGAEADLPLEPIYLHDGVVATSK